VPELLSTYWVSPKGAQALDINRGSSTLLLPIAVSHLSAFNLAISLGLVTIGSRLRKWLLIASMVLILGTVASGQVSALIGLGVILLTLTLIQGTSKAFLSTLPAGLVAGVILRPVIERRLSELDSVRGIPVSWVGRLYKLRTYFWPKLFSDYQFLLGVQPAARVASSRMAGGYVWIESSYTWMLWSGAVPFLLSYEIFRLDRSRQCMGSGETSTRQHRSRGHGMLQRRIHGHNAHGH
jgi:hypothetical protein